MQTAAKIASVRRGGEGAGREEPTTDPLRAATSAAEDVGHREPGSIALTLLSLGRAFSPAPSMRP